MINTKAKYYTLLTGNAALTTLLGGTSHISNTHPEVITVFPFVAFVDDEQSDWEYADNVPHGERIGVVIHIYTKTNTGMPTTWDIGSIVYSIFTGEYFNCSTSEVPDPTEGIRHRVMRFSRELIS